MEKIFYVYVEAKDINNLQDVFLKYGVEDYDLNVKHYEMFDTKVCFPTFKATEEVFQKIKNDIHTFEV